MNVQVFMHVPYEGLGHIEDWILSKGYQLHITEWHKGDHPYDLAKTDMLIVLGGPMGVNDVEFYPWLLEEKAYIHSAIERGLPTVGICLGAQLIAQLLGAQVAPNEHAEIGWHPIEITQEWHRSGLLSPFDSHRPVVFQWHHDGFSLPDGAIAFAKSPASPCQGFLFKQHVLALQFHLEMNAVYIKRLLNKARDELTVSGPYIQQESDILKQLHRCEQMKTLLFHLFDQWYDNLALNKSER